MLQGEGWTEKRYKNWQGKPQLYRFFYEGKTLKIMSWETPKAVYWITNTLDPQQSLNSETMICMARSMRPVTAKPPTAPQECFGRNMDV